MTYLLGALAVAVGVTYVPVMYMVLKNKRVEEVNEDWKILFTELGICKESDYLVHLEEIETERHFIEVFEVGGTITLENFQKRKEGLKEKLKTRVEIEAKGNKVKLKIKKGDLPKMKYYYQATTPNLIPVGTEDGVRAFWNTNQDAGLIIAGVPGAGKSCLLNMMISHMIESRTAELFLIDLKAGIEFGMYEGVDCVRRVDKELEAARATIMDCETVMNYRLEVLEKYQCKRIDEMQTRYPVEAEEAGLNNRVFIVVDEFADLMSGIVYNQYKPEDEMITALKKIARKGRAAGVSLILASQRLTQDSMPPTIKAVCTATVGLRTRDKHNSELIIGEAGLETLQDREAIAILGGRTINIDCMEVNQKYFDEVNNLYRCK